MNLPEPVPVTVLTGFLGSGKTTLLGRILRASAGRRTGVLVNEFGQAGLDHRIVAHVADATAVIEGGCLCCGVRPELARGLLDLLRRNLSGEARLDQLVIETSGLSDPAPIVATLRTEPSLIEHFRLAGVIATVDAASGTAAFDYYGELAKQVAAADLVVLTKTDLASNSSVHDLTERIRAMNGVVAIRDAGAPDLHPARLLDEAAAADRPRPVLVAEAVHGVRSFSISLDAPLDWPAFVVWLSMLLNRHGRELLRFKGLLNLVGEPAPVLVHGVQHIMHPPEHLEDWPDSDHRSHLVFIVRDLEPELIRRSLASFLRFLRGTIT